MKGWLVAYDVVQRKVLGVFQQNPDESPEDFHVRARRILNIWARLRPSARVDMRRADSFEDLVARNPLIFRTQADVRRAAASIGHQERVSDRRINRTAV